MNTLDVSSIRRIKIPEGLDALLEEIIRAVLKSQPKHIELFIADLVKKLIEIRNEGKLSYLRFNLISLGIY